jgi:hypothetical protein
MNEKKIGYLFRTRSLEVNDRWLKLLFVEQLEDQVEGLQLEKNRHFIMLRKGFLK